MGYPKLRVDEEETKMTGKKIFEHFQAAREEAGRKEAANWEAVAKGGCEVCHYNIGSNWPENVRPCGQFHCWHDLEEE